MIFPLFFSRWPLALALGAAAWPSLRAADPAPLVPRETLSLFNGRDLSSFTHWLADCGHEDPRRVFTVEPEVDGEPAIHISGDGFGGLTTRQSFSHFRVTAEFRWGTRTWGVRKKTARDSGMLLYCQGEDGNSRPDFKGNWPRSIEFQVIEGGTGDMLMVGGYDRTSGSRIAPRVMATVLPGTSVWNPAGIATPFSGMKKIMRIDWLHRDPLWKNEIGFRGRQDVEKPLGQWNRLEAICDGGHLVYFVNGVKVNEATDCTFRDGRLLFQSEGAEVYYRHLAVHPLSPRS